MPKAEKGSIKDLANKMKAKGLQKLRWYCQMCQKQCRDENGFKCHTTSESHQRQLLLFAENPHKYLDEFSKEFSDGYIELLRRRFGTKRVYANQVYQEYISDRNHLHMNATKWLSLSEFVTWLGKEGICNVDETEKGWYVTWIDRDPETIARQQAGMKKQKMEKDDQERMLEFIDKQVQREREKGTAPAQESQYTELVRNSEDEIIIGKLDFKTSMKPQMPKPSASSSSITASVFRESKRSRLDDDDTRSIKSSKSTSSTRTSSSLSSSSGKKQKISALEEIKMEEERRKERQQKKQEHFQQKQDNNWITEGIVVKVVTKELGDKYYKQKGVILHVLDSYVSVLRLLDSGSKLKLDQSHLETVIPCTGREVKILRGKFRGSCAILKCLHEERFCVDVEIIDGSYSGKIVRELPYEDISKIFREK